MNKTIGNSFVSLLLRTKKGSSSSTMTLPTQKPSSRYPFERFDVVSFHTRVFYPLRCVFYSLTLNGTPLSSKSPIYFQTYAYLYYPQHLVVRNSNTSTTCSMKNHFILLANWFLLTSLNIPSSCTRIADKPLMLISFKLFMILDIAITDHLPYLFSRLKNSILILPCTDDPNSPSLKPPHLLYVLWGELNYMVDLQSS